MEHNNILETLNSSALKLLAAESLEQLCTLIVEEAKNLGGFEHGAIFLQEGEKLECIYFSDPSLAGIKIKKKDDIDTAFRTNTLSILGNYTINKKFPESNEQKSKSIVIIPLSYNTQSIGIILLQKQTHETFSNRELHALKLFGSMASLAISKMNMHEETKRAVEIRDRFISLASHELRTPLTSLNGYVQLLFGKLAKKGTSESRWVEELYNETARLTSLVKDLLDINRIKQGQYAFVLSEVNIKNVIENSLERCHYTYPENEIIFEDKISDGKYMIIGDSQKLSEMLSALLTNAIKFSSSYSKISITLSRKSNAILIRVKDQGKGIPQEDLAHIFNGFYKTKHSKDKEGMGVGLLLAQHIVKLHRGKMTISSKERKGTTVDVALPSAKI